VSRATLPRTRVPYLGVDSQSGVRHMSKTKEPDRRPRGSAGSTVGEQSPGTAAMGGEARALSGVRSHSRQPGGPGGAQAGWETDTVTRLEDYFDRDQV